MENIDKKFDVDNLVQKLQSNDPQAEALMRNFESHLKGKHGIVQHVRYAAMAAAYEAAGLLEKAQDMYISAKTYAENEGNYLEADMLKRNIEELSQKIAKSS